MDSKIESKEYKCLLFTDHEWIVVTDEDNRPEDIMCSECKEVHIFIKYENAKQA